MTPDEEKALDAVCDRLAELYQRFARFQHRLAIKDDEVSVIMDELQAIEGVVEDVSNAREREAKGIR